MRWLVGCLLAIFFVPLFAGAGVVGGCIFAMANEGNPAFQGDKGNWLIFGPAVLGAAIAIALSVLVGRSIKVADRH